MKQQLCQKAWIKSGVVLRLFWVRKTEGNPRADGSSLAGSRQGLQDLMYQQSVKFVYVYDKVPCKGIKDNII